MNAFLLTPFLIVPLLLLFIRVLASSKKDATDKRLVGFSRPLMLLNIATAFWGIGIVALMGTTEFTFVEWESLGLSVRIDAMNVVLYTMITIIGFVVLRYSYTYLQGDQKFGLFIGRLSATIAFVQLFVLSGNILTLFLAWIGTSMALHHLILFYRERKKAQFAAKKKFILARIGDVTLFSGLAILYTTFGTGNLGVIFESLKSTSATIAPMRLEIAAGLFVVTAMLKSAQLPFHGWLVEVMEAPTPVSALLHAGLINAGPFLMIRMAYLLEAVQIAPIVLFVVGTLTAIYGALVFTTQSSVKSALGYSSVAHMGFTMMLCGLGAYSAALLHLTAHSFYKAHAFLSSGSAIDRVQQSGIRAYTRTGKNGLMFAGIAIAFVISALAAYAFGLLTAENSHLLVAYGVIYLAITTILVRTIDSNSSATAKLKLVGLAIGTVFAFLTFEYLFKEIANAQIPSIAAMSPALMYLAFGALLVFLITVIGITILPNFTQRTFMNRWVIHLRNGFYINLYFDRVVGALKQSKQTDRIELIK